MEHPVGEDRSGNYYYNINKDPYALLEKAKARSELSREHRPDSAAPSEGGNATFKQSVRQADDGVNLHVIPQAGFEQALLDKATSAWQSSLKGVAPEKRNYIPMVHTPAVLKEFGYKNRMIDMPSRVLEGVREKHPDIPEDVIQNLPKYLHDPQYVFNHKDGGLRMVLNATTEKGEPIAVGVEDGRIRTITPIHDDENVTGKDRVLGMAAKALGERGEKVYATNKDALASARASTSLGQSGHNSPRSDSRFAATVFGKDYLVNKHGDGFYQEARGTYHPDSRTISLLRDANLTTFNHELGHWLLDVYSRMRWTMRTAWYVRRTALHTTSTDSVLTLVSVRTSLRTLGCEPPTAVTVAVTYPLFRYVPLSCVPPMGWQPSW